MPTELTEHGDDGLWLTISQIAERRGVRKSTVSERVTELAAASLVPTKPGKGRSKLVHYASFLQAIGATGDAAKEAAVATRAAVPLEPEEIAAVVDPTFRQAQAREKQLAADLKELELKQRLGELVSVSELADIASAAAEKMIAVVDRLPNNADDMAACVGHDGVPGARAQYKRDARSLRSALVEALRHLLTVSPLTSPQPLLSEEPVQLWGDLDPALR